MPKGGGLCYKGAMTNRLAQETSPYLLQHQHNPVDWYPWGPEALERAKAENKPILLSIGYSACHWCHVMEKESFENPALAELMNQHFISIKVDREERPDLDQIYQNVAQAMTRSGGWPLTVFLTPDLKPFYGGTYFPPEDRYGRPGLARVLVSLSKAFHEDQESVLENAQKLTEFIASLESLPAVEARLPEPTQMTHIVESLLTRMDWAEGGLGGAPKFPNPMLFSFLWRYGSSVQSATAEKAKEAVLLALRKMASGGIYDHLGGGFHRYSVDASWSVPHFEKMLYDNGLLLRLYSEVLLASGTRLTDEDRELFVTVVSETTSYVRREMTSEGGGFYSAQDADSEGEEGKFFVWDLEDLSRLLSPNEARVMALRYGVTAAGNFEHGKTVLFLSQSLAEVSRVTALSLSEVRALIATAKLKLFSEREKRIKPLRDEKILISWNGLMISGLSWAAQALALAEPTAAVDAGKQSTEARKAKKAAIQAFFFLAEKGSQSAENRLYSTIQANCGKGNGFLDDYAFMARAAIDLARFSEEPLRSEGYLTSAERWVDSILQFFKGSSMGYYFTSSDHEVLIQRPKAIFDQAIPSGISVALECMTVLSQCLEGEKAQHYVKEGSEQLGALFPLAEQNAYGLGELLCLAWLNFQGPILVSGPLSSSLCRDARVFQCALKGGLDADIKKGMLVCHRQTCSLPFEMKEDALKHVESLFLLRQE